MSLVRWLLLLIVLLACGPKLPPRYVIERDIDGYRYRRYQKSLDIEIPVAENHAVGHMATYVRGGDTVTLAPVFVTVYERATGLTETVRTTLRSMDSYTFDIVRQGRANLFRMRGDSGDVWVLWVSGPHLVKIGAPQGEPTVPEALIEAYLAHYPSDLDDKGHAKPDAPSSGPVAPGTAP